MQSVSSINKNVIASRQTHVYQRFVAHRLVELIEEKSSRWPWIECCSAKLLTKFTGQSSVREFRVCRSSMFISRRGRRNDRKTSVFQHRLVLYFPRYFHDLYTYIYKRIIKIFRKPFTLPSKYPPDCIQSFDNFRKREKFDVQRSNDRRTDP